MAHKNPNSVQQIAVGVGQGPLTLGGATSLKFRTMQAAGMVDGDTTYARIQHESIEGEWENVLVTLSAGTIVRTFDSRSSSPTGALMTFSAGNKIVSAVVVGGALLSTDAAGSLQVPQDMTAGRDVTATRHVGAGGNISVAGALAVGGAIQKNNQVEAAGGANSLRIYDGGAGQVNGLGTSSGRFDFRSVGEFGFYSGSGPTLAATLSLTGIGIGTAPAAPFHCRADALNAIIIDRNSTTAKKYQISWRRQGVDTWSIGPDINGDGNQNFYVYDAIAGAARLLIDSNGRFGVGMNPSYLLDATIAANGEVSSRVGNASTGGAVSARSILELTNVPNVFGIFEIQKNNGTPYVQIAGGAGVPQMYIGVQNAIQFNINGTPGRGAFLTATDFAPTSNNLQRLGNASNRWTEVFAANGTINTSDEREKQDIRQLGDAEKRVAQALAGLVRIFRWKEAVAQKGDTARQHAGWIAQQVVAAFEAEGLDPFAYGCVGFDEVTKVETYTELRTRQKMREVSFEEEMVQVIGGQPRLVKETRTRDEPIGTMMPVVDEQGIPVMVQMPSYRDEEGNEVVPPPTPRLHFVPEMETYTHTAERIVPDMDADTGEQRKRYNIRPDQIMAFVAAGLAF